MAYKLRHKTNREISEGKFYPLGATPKDGGVNFAIYSQNAKALFLLLFKSQWEEPTDVIELKSKTKNIWHAFVHGVKAGQLYAYKVSGDYDPFNGLRFNDNKLLLDPYAKAITHKLFNKDNLLLGYDPYARVPDLSFDIRDNTHIVPKCIVVDDRGFDWQDDANPDIPANETIIYEVHIKSFTAHPSCRAKRPGTFLGFIEKIPYLKDLGVTAVEFLPVHEYYIDDYLVHKGLTNFWGYNTLCYFAPELSYSSLSYPGCQVNEFKTLVRQLHKAGIEVILDVVFNHTCEGNHLGLTVCFKGIDNPTYYHLKGGEKHPEREPGRYYMDYTGCGNSINASSQPALKLIMDSLRYWVEVMHVDGFRFDLASVLGREKEGFAKGSSFFDAISQDPVLSRVKLIAEPWDLGTYEVGNFPVDWCEWNGRFRDTVRKYVKGDPGQLAELGRRMFGSCDIYQKDGRSTFSSINFVTCHDGFTLNDLVSYNQKHNESNGENNRDGSDDNNSWNCGKEGDTSSRKIIALRKQQAKNFACYLFMAGGTPMMLGGDEFLRTQQGNNNAYCQDNEISWFDWGFLKRNKDLHMFFKKLIRFVIKNRKLRRGTHSDGNLLPTNVRWFGTNLNDPGWDNPDNRTLCFWLPQDNKEKTEDYFFIFNADYRPQWVSIPALRGKKNWHRLIDTSLKSPDDFMEEGGEPVIHPSYQYIANPRSVVVLTGK